MTDFGRVPLMEVEQPAKEEKEIFEKPKADPPKNSAEDEKKLKLKEHLKMCREKSAKVRKEKAQEKKKNKRPVGRPKKVKDPKPNINMVVEQTPVVEEDPLESIEEQAEDKTEVEIFNPETKRLETIPEDKALPPPVPKAQPTFDMDMLLNKFDERMNEKLKAFQVPEPIATPPPAIPNMGFDPNVLGFVSYMKDQEEKIRNEERKKYVMELEQKKNETLMNNTRKYFSRLPPRQFQAPVPTQPKQTDIWDDLLNPRRK
tara:strand:+ start:170 stop:946 length:777 start_codon:yes stop_codon:yes gene_type:complete